MNSNFNCNYMAMSSLTNILGFSMRFFQPVCSIQEYYEIKITSKSFAQKFELKGSLGGPLSKLCVTPPFSINFRCQIENQVSDYKLLGASSFPCTLVSSTNKTDRHHIAEILLKVALNTITLALLFFLFFCSFYFFMYKLLSFAVP